MITIKITDKMYDQALQFQKYRDKLKSVLAYHNLCFDKFTCTTRDSSDGYLAEICVANYLKTLGKNVYTWEQIYSLSSSITHKLGNPQSLTPEEVENLKNYFYDKWDLEVDSKKVDVKCAATHKKITPYWSYGLPEIQINKPGKEYVILAYIIYDKDPKFDTDAKPVECKIIGFKEISEIQKNYKVVTVNSYAGFSYKTPNYELKVSTFKDLKDF